MALQFNSIQPVRFGEIEATPKMTTSSRMRVQKVKFGGDNIEAMETLAECFGNNSDGVLDFMKKNMTTLDLQRLQAYLIGGESMLDTLDHTIDEVIKASMKKVQNEED